MALYQLSVFHSGKASPTEVVQIAAGKDVAAAITELLKVHPDCHRIRVESGAMHLFSVDCHGNDVDR